MNNQSNIKFLIIAFIIGFSLSYIFTNDGKVVTIDNCQYMKTFTGSGFTLIHKGNCTNIIHHNK